MEESNASSSSLSLTLTLCPPLFPLTTPFTKQSWHWSERRKIEEYYKSLNASK